MDNKSLSKQESKELARESLIAISNASPETVLDSNSALETKTSDVVAVTNLEGDDKFRSELISISYAESLNVKSTSMGV
ncbi:hypothetical protein TanjilG_02952 [Lupinus angustifolius]|uniref:Uncharacterized protein n=1 Tax=Lupinus angustifolius TaxID=3871 RepID=A0A1J7FZH0_LUPAN|nr:PREDICTED: uncharacterized protein LOC109332350 [Lupinus angustifolius]OIV93415.1 hypothetical protein TanjilG_02952 [Lupinus angustifolius]